MGGHCRNGLRLLVVAAVLIACTPDRAPRSAPGPSAPDTSVVQAGNDADRDRLSTIHQIRAIDICALYGQARAVAGSTLAIEAPTSPKLCRARIGEDADNIAATISLAVGPVALPKPQSWVKHASIDGTDVTVADALDAPNMPPRDQVVAANCEWTATYPGSVRLSALVTAPPRIDGCALGHDLMQVALREYAKRPLLTASSVPRTVIAGADPCRAPSRLRPAHTISWDIPDFSTHECAFGIDGGADLYLSLEYADPSRLASEPGHFGVGGHAVSGDAQTGIFNVVIGQEFRVGTATLAPVASISDPAKNMDQIRLVAQAVADEY